jgi:hypothetical protein
MLVFYLSLVGKTRTLVSYYLDNVMFLHSLARDLPIPAFLYGVTLATGIWQSPSSEHDMVELFNLLDHQ